MSRRFFKLTNFRNIGLNGNTDNKIVINNSLEKGKMGAVIELIGANNSGKSNVLDAICEYGQKSLSDRDVTTLSFNDADRNPQVSLVYQDDNGTIEHVLSRNGVVESFDIKGYKKTELKLNEVVDALSRIKRLYNDYGLNGAGVQNLIEQLNAAGKMDNNSTQLLNDFVLNLKNASTRNSSYRTIYNELLRESIFKDDNNKKL